jgi:hypothetical protein
MIIQDIGSQEILSRDRTIQPEIDLLGSRAPPLGAYPLVMIARSAGCRR